MLVLSSIPHVTILLIRRTRAVTTFRRSTEILMMEKAQCHFSSRVLKPPDCIALDYRDLPDTTLQIALFLFFTFLAMYSVWFRGQKVFWKSGEALCSTIDTASEFRSISLPTSGVYLAPTSMLPRG